jgi:protein phosphatase
MGGHVAGEKAASLAIAELSGVRGAISPQRLIDVARAANRRVFDAAQAPELRGMGTTLVIASFDPADGVINIANIGDSRGYLFRDGTYRQITLDHSLVEELLRQGRLTGDEAKTHPQRNMVTRALGIGPEVEVDVFTIEARAGDRIVLCSDGLSNEVDDERVAEILASTPDPDEAAEALVEAAVQHGGRDNVTVVLLDLIDDPDLELPLLVADPDEPDPDLDEPSDPDEPSEPVRRDLTADPLADTKRPAKRRRLPFRGLIYAGSVLSVILIAFTATAWYARSAYYVDDLGGTIVIMQGRPGGVLWFQPDQVEETSLRYDELDPASQVRVDSLAVLGSIGEAHEFVANLKTREG